MVNVPEEKVILVPTAFPVIITAKHLTHGRCLIKGQEEMEREAQGSCERRSSLFPGSYCQHKAQAYVLCYGDYDLCSTSIGAHEKCTLLLSLGYLHTRENMWLLGKDAQKLSTCQTSVQNERGECNLNVGETQQIQSSCGRWSRRVEGGE
jgi:hypothetical protein